MHANNINLSIPKYRNQHATETIWKDSKIHPKQREDCYAAAMSFRKACNSFDSVRTEVKGFPGLQVTRTEIA
jgi:hypothetical protein